MPVQVFVLYCDTMHEHGSESDGHVLFCVTVSNASGTCIEIKLNLFGNLCRAEQTLTVCLSRHRLKQIKLCFNSRAGCEQHCAQMEGFVFSHIKSVDC